MENRYVLIYNKLQNKFYINEKRLKIEEVGTGKFGDAFIKYEVNEEYNKAFSEWCDRRS